MPKIIENVRSQLLEEAKKQITEIGYSKTTIRSVAGSCGLAVGTVYNYFPSKDMLIASFMLEDWNHCLERVRNEGVVSARELLKSLYGALVEFSKMYEGLFRNEDAAKVFSLEFFQRHTMLRDQISEIILPLCGDLPRSERKFTADFAAEGLLTWTMQGADLDKVSEIILKILK